MVTQSFNTPRQPIDERFAPMFIKGIAPQLAIVFCHHAFAMSWLRVFRSANTAHLGHSGGQKREPGVMPSEKYAARRGSVEDGMRMITACFARAPQRCTSRTYVHFLLMFQEVRLVRKTRNQLQVKVWIL